MNARPRKPIDTSTYEGRFAARLKMLREKAGLSPENAAEAIGISVSSIWSWESGRSIPHVSLYPSLSALYNLKKVKDLLPNE